MEYIGNLTRGKCSRSYRTDKARGLLKFAALSLARVEHPNPKLAFVPNHADRLDKVRVIGDHDRNVEVLTKRVHEQMACKIDVQSLFF